MIRRKTLWILAVGMVMSPLTATAQVNSPLPEGYASRGVLMLADENVPGATAQLQHYTTEASKGDAKADMGYARALMLSGRYLQAREAMQHWLMDYPGDPHAATMQALMGQCHLLQHQWAEAAQVLKTVNADALAGDDLIHYQYALAYAQMMLGEYPGAAAAFEAMPSWAPEQYRNAAVFYRGYVAFAQGRYAEARTLLESANAIIEPATAAPYYLGQIYYMQDEYAKALTSARQAQRLSLPRPLQAENLRIIGECQYQQGQMAEAVNTLRQYAAMVTSPQPSTLYILGKALYDQRQWREAITSLSPVADKCDNAMGQSAYLYIGQAYIQLDDTQAALLAFNKAIEMPYDPEVQQTAFYDYAVATVEGAGVPFGSSVKVLEEFLSRYPSSPYAPKVQEYVIAGYITDNDYDAALASINKVTKPTEAVLRAKQRVLYTLGSRALEAQKPEEAQRHLNEASRLGRYDADIAAEVILLLGDAQYRQGRYDRAADQYLEYIRLRPQGSNTALARYNLGYARLGQKRFDDAVIDFQRALQSGQLDISAQADAWNRIGDARYYTSQFDAAAEAYGHAYEKAPTQGDYARYQQSVMYGLARQYQRQIDAIEAFDREFAASPLIPASLLDKAVALNQLGRADEAVKTYEVIIERYPSSPKAREAYIQMAQMLENQGQTPRAVEAYKHIVSAYPTSDEASVAVMALKRIGADDGNIAQYATYISGVKGAPGINPDEVTAIEFTAAEKDYQDQGRTTRLLAFVNAHPEHPSAAEALAYLAEAADNDEATLDYSRQILERFPHSAAAIDALELTADIELRRGRAQAAANAYSQLIERGGADEADRAHQGLMRAYDALSQADSVITHAEALLASSSLAQADRAEAVCLRGKAHAAQGRTQEARDDWQSVASLTNLSHGAQAAVLLGQSYLDAKQYDKAVSTVQALINAKTPQQYWLARAFIVLSDARRAQGRTFEADEYLKALKQNYPGQEADIHQMINSRLSK